MQFGRRKARRTRGETSVNGGLLSRSWMSVIDLEVDVVNAGITVDLYPEDEVPGPEIRVAINRVAAVNRNFSRQYGTAWLVGHGERLKGEQ